jgi:hypothetical protein
MEQLLFFRQIQTQCFDSYKREIIGIYFILEYLNFQSKACHGFLVNLFLVNLNLCLKPTLLINSTNKYFGVTSENIFASQLR